MLYEYVAVLITAMLPVSELRGAIPLGLAAFSLPVVQVYMVAIIGNMIPIIFLLWFWKYAGQHIMHRSKFSNNICEWMFERTRKKFYEKHKKFGDIALLLFVAIPLPITGAWTGSIAAWIFGIPYSKALKLIFFGVLISGIIVTAITKGVIHVI